jgi:predicted nucleotidyltransferase
VLRARRDDLRAKGIKRAAVFGSVARGDDRNGSDIDILIDIDPSVAPGVFGLVDMLNEVRDLFEDRVDVIPRDGLKPAFLARIAPEMIYAF